MIAIKLKVGLLVIARSIADGDRGRVVSPVLDLLAPSAAELNSKKVLEEKLIRGCI